MTTPTDNVEQRGVGMAEQQLMADGQLSNLIEAYDYLLTISICRQSGSNMLQMLAETTKQKANSKRAKQQLEE